MNTDSLEPRSRINANVWHFSRESRWRDMRLLLLFVTYIHIYMHICICVEEPLKIWKSYVSTIHLLLFICKRQVSGVAFDIHNDQLNSPFFTFCGDHRNSVVLQWLLNLLLVCLYVIDLLFSGMKLLKVAPYSNWSALIGSP